MTVALRSPSDVSAIISVDNAPVSVPLSNDFAKYVRGMKEIEEAKVTKQKEADEILAQYEEVGLQMPSYTRGFANRTGNSHSPSGSSSSRTSSAPKTTMC